MWYYNGATYPCKLCKLSRRNSIHTSPRQYGYHVYVEVAEDEIKGDEMAKVTFDGVVTRTEVGISGKGEIGDSAVTIRLAVGEKLAYIYMPGNYLTGTKVRVQVEVEE